MSVKTIFITGASAGFGEACARAFAAQGHRLVLAARRLEKLETLCGALPAAAGVHLVRLDVRDRCAVDAAVASLPVGFREIDVLVNNAGLALGLKPSHQADIDDWDVMVDTNIKGLMYCTRAILPGMVERNRGYVINISSVAASWPYPGGNAYGGSKAFVSQFSRNLRCDLLGTRVRVTCIEPGMAETEFSLVRFKGDDERAAQVYSGTEAMSADDIAEIVTWVAGRPEHININTLEVMPTDQAWGPFAVHRTGG
jgi:NADP-dependent 3-hydroxy acid dehydrogenase YdfG